MNEKKLRDHEPAEAQLLADDSERVTVGIKPFRLLGELGVIFWRDGAQHRDDVADAW